MSFIKAGELPQELSRFLSDTFDLRHLSDYDETIIITQKQAEITLEHTKIFLDEASNWIENHS